ncbi:hypothetical protein ABW19_dt0200195 [Dactylella cylindrospora]|nr:hypothetical protein ABW19_dt0200195 [Dactylella cylindrospora]
MSLTTTLSLTLRTHLLTFISCAFQSLDSPIVRKECAPLVSIGIWQNFHSDVAREAKLGELPHFRKPWRAAAKKFASADQKSQAKMKFERSWIYLLTLDFISIIHSKHGSPDANESSLYAERMVEFFTDLLSQLPTRRYVHGLLEDLQIIPSILLSPLYASPTNWLLRDLVSLLEHFFYFQEDSEDNEGSIKTSSDSRYRRNLGKLQKASLQVSKSKLVVLGLANHASISKKDDLLQHLSLLDDTELKALAVRLNIRQNFPEDVPYRVDRQFMLCCLVERFSKRATVIDDVKTSPLLPTEESLFSKSHTRNDNYNGSRPLAIPKANLQYLSIEDFLWRMFFLFKAESFFEIRRDLQETLRRLKPSVHSGNTIFNGTSRMALQIKRLSVLEVAPPRVGESVPSQVRAEIDLPLENVSNEVRREWESLRPDDVVFLLCVHPLGHGDLSGLYPDPSLGDAVGIKHLRSAEVIQSPGEQRHNAPAHPNDKRKLHVRLDRLKYMKQDDREGDIYSSFNLIIRRKGIENNFKPILASIRSLIQESDNCLPDWFRDVFLGYGDPTEASFPFLKPRPKTINFRDTLLDLQHLQTSLENMSLTVKVDSGTTTGPFILTEIPDAQQTRKASKEDDVPRLSYRVSSSHIEKSGPYTDKSLRKQASIKYTNAQVNAIFSGTNSGITLVVGPPGTGKTDVASQIICNLYHNFPNERTLVIAHSNQALNQLLQKITVKDIDERHLLRLGHGEDELQSSSNFSKYGRVENIVELRNKLLLEVDRLALSVEAPGAHGNSCETAYYFNRTYVVPLWEAFLEGVSIAPSAETVLNKFPFYAFFSDAQTPILPSGASFESTMSAAEGCYRHISKIFVELEDIRPFEILRNSRDKAAYLLTKEARIIAMTSTHAAIKRDEIVRQGFRYDNIVMEEAAQVTEIETFIPLALQSSQTSHNSVKRIVLCGDHFQNSPVVQHLGFRQFANMEQSLFSRFVRLGVPTILLDQQGRSRPSIASLYNWRYLGLGNLDYLHQQDEFLRANAGLRHEFQFINVEDFKGHGEQEPSPHFIQNLGEAEYAVALFQYMRLLGYPAQKISILSSYSGQRALIRDILDRRCAKNPFFGSPAHVTTIDKFQGEQNDYIILSLVRTNRVGYLRDIRRLTVALSRARLGLYIFGRLKTFETCYELKEAFSRLLEKPTKLELTTGEMWPTDRLVASSANVTVMDGLEHLGQYVYEMTQAKVKSLKQS